MGGGSNCQRWLFFYSSLTPSLLLLLVAHEATVTEAELTVAPCSEGQECNCQLMPACSVNGARRRRAREEGGKKKKTAVRLRCFPGGRGQPLVAGLRDVCVCVCVCRGGGSSCNQVL